MNSLKEFKDIFSFLEPYKERILGEVNFALSLASFRQDKRKEWEDLIKKALDKIKEGLNQGASLQEVVEEAERIMSPIGKVAKEYTIHYIGHAHLDMNWLWDWSETVESMYGTFSTMDKLMNEFPDFCFSQSSAVDYATIEEYSPTLFDRIKKRVKEGRWEITASTWVEGDKNMASGEALVRQILYAKKYFAKKLGLDFDKIKIDWAPDTFGHPWTYPQIMKDTGIKYYYFNRGGKEHRLFWWEAPDGSRVLAWNDGKYLYPGHPQQGSVRYHRDVRAEDVCEVLEHERKTGMKDYIIVYGLGDHGGGPTRRYIKKIKEFKKWPIFPKVKFSTIQEFFEIASKYGKNLPVIKDELNFPFPGCYTSQSRIKHANREMENKLPLTETLATCAKKSFGFFYPREKFEESWRKLCFNQFHDILPGSGIRETREHALGNYQEVKAFCSIIREQIFDIVAGNLKTEGKGIPIVVFNPCMWERNDIVEVVIYEPPEDAKEFVIVDEKEKKIPFQVYGSSKELRKIIEKEENPFAIRPIALFFDAHLGHEYLQGCFTAYGIPPFGFKVYWLQESESVVFEDTVKVKKEDNKAVLENEFYRLEIDGKSGALISLYDKVQKKEFVPEGEKFGLLSIWQEEPHRMSAWEIGAITHIENLESGGKIEIKEKGPVRGVVQYHNKYKDSTFTLNIILQRGIPEIKFSLEVDWLERGGPEKGVPSLKVSFPLNIENPRAIFDIPFGNIERPTNGKEVPAQEWVDVHDAKDNVGVTFVNDHTYGHSVKKNTLYLTLLRSSYDPDPLPEQGKHIMNYSLFPHGERWTPGEATRRSIEFNLPFFARCVEPHKGDASSYSFISVEPADVVVSCFKLAEEGDDIILRLNEVNGKECVAKIKIPWKILEAVEVDLLERPLREVDGESISIDSEGNLKVKMQPYKIKTISLKVES